MYSERSMIIFIFPDVNFRLDYLHFTVLIISDYFQQFYF
jgi:hypothetical protein